MTRYVKYIVLISSISHQVMGRTSYIMERQNSGAFIKGIFQNGFNQIAKSPLEEWIYYLNTGEIPSSATALELEEARERLKLDSMTKDELVAYYRHLDNIVILRDNIYTEREEGRAEGREEANWDNARNLKKTGSSY